MWPQLRRVRPLLRAALGLHRWTRGGGSPTRGSAAAGAPYLRGVDICAKRLLRRRFGGSIKPLPVGRRHTCCCQLLSVGDLAELCEQLGDGVELARVVTLSMVSMVSMVNMVSMVSMVNMVSMVSMVSLVSVISLVSVVSLVSVLNMVVSMAPAGCAAACPSSAS